MALKSYPVTVMRAMMDDNGQVWVRCRFPDQNPGDQWHIVEPGTPGAGSFLAIALTCLATGLPAEILIDDPPKDDSHLVQLQIVRG